MSAQHSAVAMEDRQKESLLAHSDHMDNDSCSARVDTRGSANADDLYAGSDQSPPAASSDQPNDAQVVVMTDPATEEKPFDFWYGWVVAICVFLVQFGVYGTMNSYSTFSHLMEEDESLGHPTSSQISVGNAIANGVAPLISVLAGNLVDHLGPRIVLAASAVLCAIASFISSFATDITTLVLLYSIPACLGSSCLSTPGTAAVASWMKRHLNTAMGIAYAGNGAGSSFIVLFAGYLASSSLGWRASFRIMAICPVIGFVAAMFIVRRVKPKPRPPLSKQDVGFLKQLVRNPSYWFLFLGCGLFSFTFFSALYLIVPFAMDFGRAGTPYEKYEKIEGKTAGSLFTFFGVVKWLSSWTLGFAANKTEPRLVASFCASVLCITCCFWAMCEHYYQLAIVSSFLGFGVAGVFATLPSMASRCFFGPRVGLGVGLVMAAFAFGGFAGPPVITSIKEASNNSYTLSLGAMGLSAGMAAIVLFFGLDGRVQQQEFALLP